MASIHPDYSANTGDSPYSVRSGYISYATSSGGNHTHTFSTDTQGEHTHIITVNATGGTETRPRNIALMAIIKY